MLEPDLTKITEQLETAVHAYMDTVAAEWRRTHQSSLENELRQVTKERDELRSFLVTTANGINDLLADDRLMEDSSYEFLDEMRRSILAKVKEENG